MHKILFPTLFTLLFLLQTTLISAWVPFTSYQGFDYFDLYGPSVNDMTQLAVSWTVVNPVGATKISSCGIPYMGGPGVMNKNSAFKKTFTNLPAHNIIYYTLSIYTLDGWTASDSFSIQFDSVTVFTYFPSVAQTKLATTSLCVGSNKDLYNPYSGTVSHSDTSLTFQITVNIVSNSAQPAYFGFRDLQFSFRNDSTGIAQATKILTADSTVPSASTCAAGSYKNTVSNTCQGCTSSSYCQGAVSYNCYWGSHHSNSNPDTCVACETDCALCSNSAAGNCVLCTFAKTLDLDGTCKTSCSAGTKLTNGGDASFFACVSPCVPTNKWTKWDYTCLTTCDFPLVQKDKGIQGLFCQYPCNKATEFLYWNGSCLTSCSYYTRNEAGYRFCDACQPNYFLYPDKTCAATCPPPSTQTVTGGSKFCNPCVTDIYYYANNKTCSGVCQDLFVISYAMAFTYCDFPCPAGQFLYPNTSCSSTCQPAFSQRTENTLKFCDYPCTGSQYLYANGSCSYSCQYNFRQRTENSYQFCDYPCNSGYYLYPNGSCYSSCQPAFSHRQEGSNDFCDYPCSLSAYLYKNGSCQSTCQLNFLVRNEGSFKFCDYPCNSGYYLYSNGSCYSSCQPNFNHRQEGSNDFCDYPCSLSAYLYPNGSCKATCQTNFAVRNEGSFKFCDYPCSSGDYLYPNGSCYSSCQPNFNHRQEGTFDFCDYPCSLSAYLYPNGSCKATCQTSFAVRQEGSFKFCDYPCNSGDYLYPNGSCYSSCQPNFNHRQEGTFDFCDYPCSLSAYLYPNGSCKSTCQTSFAVRTEGSFKFCDYPCNSGDYLYPNGSCYSSCQPNFNNRQEGTFDFCDYPCSLSAYLYPNGSCKSTCQTSFAVRTEGSFKFCDYPCSSGDYLYSNGSCYSSCQPYFNNRQEGSYDFCDYPCSLSWFLYQNGTCKSTCQTGLTVRNEGSFKFCDYVCAAGQYAYRNGSCLSTCQPYFNHRQEGTFDFCDYPCKLSSFLYQNGSCASYCQTGFVQRNENGFQFCDFPCLAGEYRFPNNDTCNTDCFSPFTERIEGSYYFCDEPITEIESELTLEQIKQSSDLAKFIKAIRYMVIFGALFLNIFGFDLQSFCLITIFELILYNRYINVEFSPLFQDVLYRLPAEASFFNLVTDADEKIHKNVESDQIPYPFERYNLHSTYLGNHWASLLTIVVALTIAFTIKLVVKITKDRKKNSKVLEYLKSKFLWNILLLLAIENYPGVVIYTSLDLRTTDSGSAWKVFSSILCVIVNLLAVLVFYISIKIILDYRKSARNTVFPETNNSTSNQKKPSAFERKWKDFSVFWANFKHTKLLSQQAFIPIFIVRAYLIGLIIGYFFAYPLFQGISLFIINGSMFSYIIIKKPFKTPFEKIIHMIQESLILATSFCMLILASLQEDKYSPRKVFAGIILYSTPIICLICLILCISKIIVLLKSSKTPAKRIRPEKIKAPKESAKNRMTEDHSPDLTARSLSPNQASPSDDLTQNMSSINKLLSSPLKAGSPSAGFDVSFSQTLSPEKTQRERFSFKVESLKVEVEDLGSSTSIINLQNNKQPSSEVQLIGGTGEGRRRRGARNFSKRSTLALHIPEEQENILN